MRICIYKSDRAPELTLLLREGLPMPLDIRIKDWSKIKVVTQTEMRSDLLLQLGDTGHLLVSTRDSPARSSAWSPLHKAYRGPAILSRFALLSSLLGALLSGRGYHRS